MTRPSETESSQPFERRCTLRLRQLLADFVAEVVLEVRVGRAEYCSGLGEAIVFAPGLMRSGICDGL
jgi:hypothetical protein